MTKHQIVEELKIISQQLCSDGNNHAEHMVDELILNINVATNNCMLNEVPPFKANLGEKITYLNVDKEIRTGKITNIIGGNIIWIADLDNGEVERATLVNHSEYHAVSDYR